MTVLTKRLTIPEIVKTTGFTKKEEGLLERACNLSNILEKIGDGRNHMAIGGFALRVYINPEFTGRIGNGTPTDLDLVFIDIPPQIRKKLNEERLIDIARRYAGSMGEVQNSIIYSDYPVYHLKPELAGANPELADMCFFQKRVGMITIIPEDIRKARTIEACISTDTTLIEASIRIADPGTLLATTLNPFAITDKRAWRAALLLASIEPEETIDAIARYVNITQFSGITSEQLELTLKQFENTGKRKGFLAQVDQFVTLAIELIRAKETEGQN